MALITRRQILALAGALSALFSSTAGGRKSKASAPPSASKISYPQTAGEAELGIAPLDCRHAPGVVDRYGTNANPGVTDMSLAVQTAARADCGSISFLESTYLFSDVSIAKATVVQGRGVASKLLARNDRMDSSRYSRNLFTCTEQIDYLTFKDVALDGGCDNANGGHPHEVALVKITASKQVTFKNVKLTRYCGGWDGVTKAVSASFFQAITIQNAERVAFLSCLLANNHYEQVLIWSGPASECETLIDSCSEENDGVPNSHTAFDINGGHVVVTNNRFRNTGATSTLNIQVPKSARVANNVFLDMQSGAAAQINVGQSTFPGNDNVVIESNYCRNANSAAIEVGPGSNIMIRGNIIDTPTNYGVQITSGVNDFATFNTLFPEWPSGKISASNGITICDNIINGVSNAEGLSRAIFMHTVVRGAGWWFRNVKIARNTITAAAPPRDTFCGLWLNDMYDCEIIGNQLHYSKTAIYFTGVVRNVRVESNTFSSVAPVDQNDIIFFGPYASTNVFIGRNRFTNFPVGPTYNIYLSQDYSIAGLGLFENIGLHPVLPVFAGRSTSIVQRQTRDFSEQREPLKGDWGINDIAKNTRFSSLPEKYLCVVAGSFGTALTCTATGMTGECFFTCNSIEQLHVGQHFSVSGAGPASKDLKCTCVYLKGKTFYVDQTISTTVSGARMLLTQPVFKYIEKQNQHGT